MTSSCESMLLIVEDGGRLGEPYSGRLVVGTVAVIFVSIGIGLSLSVWYT